jgi:outer membrane immunogenic protein
MKRLLVGCAVATAALSTSFAADIAPVFKAAPPPSPAYDWSGFYAGLNGGSSWGSTPYAYSGGLGTTGGTLSPDGFVGGGQFGYNMQRGALVFGLEGDVAWRGGSAASTFLTPAGSARFAEEHKWVATIRPRLGIADGNWLVYGTGGVAFGSFEHGYTETLGAASRTLSDTTTRAGWTAGGGVQFAPSNRWSLGLEYLYQDFGKTTLSQPAQTVGGVAFPSSSTTFNDRAHVLRGRVDFKFGWDDPVRRN